MPRSSRHREPVVITGIGLIASVGHDRESVWNGVRNGRSAVRRLTGLPGIPDGMLLGAPVDLERDVPDELKVISLCDRAADEAIFDAQIDFDAFAPSGSAARSVPTWATPAASPR